MGYNGIFNRKGYLMGYLIVIKYMGYLIVMGYLIESLTVQMDNGQTIYDNRTLITSVATSLGSQATTSAAISPKWSGLLQ